LERKVSEAKHRFLSGESQKWVDEGIISAEQRGGILASYSAVKKLPVVVLTLGMTMIGAGVLMFIASNWQNIGRAFKIILIVGAYLASVLGAYKFERAGRDWISNSLLFLSGFLLLGGIALISQVFHISGSVDGLLVTWIIVFAPTFLLVRNVAVYVFYEVVAIIYANFIYTQFWDWGRSYDYYTQDSVRPVFDIFTMLNPWQPTAILALLIFVAWWEWRAAGRNPGMLSGEETWARKFFIGGATRRIFYVNFFVINWFTWICVMNSRHETVLPYVLGVLIIGGVISVMAWKLDAFDLDWQGLLCVGIPGMALTFPNVWNSGYYRNGSYEREFASDPAALISSLALGAYLIYRIINRKKGGGFSVFLFCALLARWYCDMFYTLMSRSMFFIFGGLVLLGIAYACVKWNRRLNAEAVSEGERAGDLSGGDDNDDSSI
jgi:hypothetical protein